MKRLGIFCGKNDENFILAKYYVEMFNVFDISVSLIPIGSLYDIQMFDGIVLTGGGDIHSVLFGEKTIPQLRSIDLERDVFEIEICRNTIKEGKSLIGICKGMQIINVALGGNLIQDLEETRKMIHDGHNHLVSVVDNSFINITRCKLFAVNSFHHQAVNKLANNLKPVLYSQDGTIEGFIDEGLGNILGLQFHPERIYNLNQAVFSIIKNFCSRI